MRSLNVGSVQDVNKIFVVIRTGNTVQYISAIFHHWCVSTSSIRGGIQIPFRRGSLISPYRSPHHQVRPSQARAG